MRVLLPLLVVFGATAYAGPQANDSQVAYKLYEDARIQSVHVEAFGQDILDDKNGLQLFQMKSIMQMPTSIEPLKREGFWDFKNLSEVFPNVDFFPVDRASRALVSHPVTESTFGLIPDHLDCELTQKIAKPEDEDFQKAWARLGPLFKTKKAPNLVLIQECRNFNMIFKYSLQTIFFSSNGNRTDIMAVSDFFIKKTTLAKLNKIPFLRPEKKIGNILTKEFEDFRSSISRFTKGQR